MERPPCADGHSAQGHICHWCCLLSHGLCACSNPSSLTEYMQALFTRRKGTDCVVHEGLLRSGNHSFPVLIVSHHLRSVLNCYLCAVLTAPPVIWLTGWSMVVGVAYACYLGIYPVLGGQLVTAAWQMAYVLPDITTKSSTSKESQGVLCWQAHHTPNLDVVCWHLLLMLPRVLGV